MTDHTCMVLDAHLLWIILFRSIRRKERTVSHVYDHNDSEGAKIYMMLVTAAEPEFLMADMTPEQLRLFAAYKAKLNVRFMTQ